MVLQPARPKGSFANRISSSESEPRQILSCVDEKRRKLPQTNSAVCAPVVHVTEDKPSKNLRSTHNPPSARQPLPPRRDPPTSEPSSSITSDPLDSAPLSSSMHADASAQISAYLDQICPSSSEEKERWAWQQWGAHAKQGYLSCASIS